MADSFVPATACISSLPFLIHAANDDFSTITISLDASQAVEKCEPSQFECLVGNRIFSGLEDIYLSFLQQLSSLVSEQPVRSYEFNNAFQTSLPDLLKKARPDSPTKAMQPLTAPDQSSALDQYISLSAMPIIPDLAVISGLNPPKFNSDADIAFQMSLTNSAESPSWPSPSNSAHSQFVPLDLPVVTPCADVDDKLQNSEAGFEGDDSFLNPFRGHRNSDCPLQRSSEDRGGGLDPREKRAEEENVLETFKCGWGDCKVVFQSLEQRIIHLKDTHLIRHSPLFHCHWRGCPRKKPFAALYMLELHARQHSGAKPYKCTATGCDKRYSRLENLKTHSRAHQGIRPFTCGTCAKTFTNASDCAKHMYRTHSGEKSYCCECEGCEKSYTDPSSLRKHIKTVHGAHVYEEIKARRSEKGVGLCARKSIVKATNEVFTLPGCRTNKAVLAIGAMDLNQGS